MKNSLHNHNMNQQFSHLLCNLSTWFSSSHLKDQEKLKVINNVFFVKLLVRNLISHLLEWPNWQSLHMKHSSLLKRRHFLFQFNFLYFKSSHPPSLGSDDCCLPHILCNELVQLFSFSFLLLQRWLSLRIY